MIGIVLLFPMQTMRAGLRSLLGSEEGIEVLFDGASLSELTYDSDLRLPLGTDVIITHPDAFEVDVLKQFLLQSDIELSILLLSDDSHDAHSVASLPLQAWGIISLDANQEELLAAVNALYEGLFVGEPDLIQPMLNQVMVSGADAEVMVEELTDRETEVLQLLAQGLANKQIALQLGISPHTVKFHVSSLYTKLGVTNRIEAVTAGARLGMIVL